MASFFRLTLFFAGVVSACATITITETGERFDSRPDQNLGKQLLPGFEYMSRLQYIGHQLCNPSKTSPMWRVIVPEDGVPGTLLVFAGGCTTEEKVQNAAIYLQPAGVVKYLIVAGDDHVNNVKRQEWKTEESLFNQINLSSFLRVQGTDLVVLHTSINTGYGLLQTLNKATAETLKAGGPRIMLDNRVRRKALSGEAAGWLTVSLLLGACACCFMVAVKIQTGAFFPEDEPVQPRPRHVLQRLSTTQVDAMYPVYEFNGSQLVHPRGAHRHSIPPTPVEFSMCSICLDDYLPNDKIRCLQPCNHAFHSTCIAKWLTERSACCPLCKLDLYVEEDEEDDDEEEDPSIVGEPEVREAITQTERAAAVTWWQTLFGGQPIEQLPPAEANLQQPLLSGSAASQTEEMVQVSLWRRLFPRRDSERHAGLETTTYNAPRIEIGTNLSEGNQQAQSSIDPELAGETQVERVSDMGNHHNDQTSVHSPTSIQ